MSLHWPSIFFLIGWLLCLCQGDLESDIDLLVNAGISARGIPGLSLTVVKDGTVALAKGYGVKDVDTQDPVTADTLFGIASCTKAFATTLLAKLLRNSPSFTLSTNIYKILGRDETKFNDTLRSTYATLEDLMAHSMGIPRNNFMRLDTALTRDNLMARLQYLPSKGGFRRSFNYNDVMYGLLAHVTEVLGGPGKTWEELMTSEIFQPLSMTNSTFLTTVDFSCPDVATPYSVESNKNAVKTDPAFVKHYAGLGGSGAIMSTANDMAKWLLFHVSGGKNQQGQQVVQKSDLETTYKPLTALTPSTIQKQMSRPVTPVTMSADGYGLGWKTGYYREFKILQHTGSTYGYKSIITILPHSSSAIFTAFSGSDDDYGLRSALHSTILDLLLGETPWINSTTIATFPLPWSGANRKRRALTDTADDRTSDEEGDTSKIDEEKDLMARETDRETSILYSRQIHSPDVNGHPLQDFVGTFAHGAYGTATIEIDPTTDRLKMAYGIGQWELNYSGSGYLFDADWLGPSPSFDVQIEFLVNGDVYGFECLDCDTSYVPAFYRQA